MVEGSIKVNLVDTCANNVAGKPNSLVIVVIEKCVDLPALVNNESSNPYVEIKSRGKRYKTQVVKETVEPLFQERIPGISPCLRSAIRQSKIELPWHATRGQKVRGAGGARTPSAATAPPVRCCN
jgi:hypothetical protein